MQDITMEQNYSYRKRGKERLGSSWRKLSGNLFQNDGKNFTTNQIKSIFFIVHQTLNFYTIYMIIWTSCYMQSVTKLHKLYHTNEVAPNNTIQCLFLISSSILMVKVRNLQIYRVPNLLINLRRLNGCFNLLMYRIHLLHNNLGRNVNF